MNNYFTLLPELPRVPDWILDSIDINERPNDVLHLNKDPSKWQQQDYQWIVPTAGGKIGRKIFSPEVTRWFIENIAGNFNQKNAGWMYFDEQFPPHCDVTRDWVLLYNLKTGGDDVKLTFFQEKGKDTINVRGAEFDDESSLTELFTVDSPPEHCWYLLYTQVVHGIRNQTSTRVNLQLSFEAGITPDIFKGESK